MLYTHAGWPIVKLVEVDSSPQCELYIANVIVCMQMVQAIQVLRFHLLELEKVRIGLA